MTDQEFIRNFKLSEKQFKYLNNILILQLRNLEINHYMQIEEVDAWLNCKPIPNLKINTEPNSVQELVSRDIINKGINNIKSLLTMGKAKLKPIEVEYIQWEDNLSEMKMFCKDNCKITYEYAVGIDCYWNLLIISDQQKWLTVPLHSYVIKLPDRFLVMNETEFKEYLDIINEKIPG